MDNLDPRHPRVSGLCSILYSSLLIVLRLRERPQGQPQPIHLHMIPTDILGSPTSPNFQTTSFLDTPVQITEYHTPITILPPPFSPTILVLVLLWTNESYIRRDPKVQLGIICGWPTFPPTIFHSTKPGEIGLLVGVILVENTGFCFPDREMVLNYCERQIEIVFRGMSISL
jgi:hypothetical protein